MAGAVHLPPDIGISADLQPWCAPPLHSFRPVLERLECWLAGKATVLAPYRWPAFFEAFPGAARDPILAHFVEREKTVCEVGVDRQALVSAAPADRAKLLEKFLRAEFANITGLALADADLEKPLNSFGLDSLMAIQLRNRVEAELQISLSLVDFLKGLSLAEIVRNASREIAQEPGPTEQADPLEETLGDLKPESVEGLSEGELDSYLLSLIDQTVVKNQRLSEKGS